MSRRTSNPAFLPLRRPRRPSSSQNNAAYKKAIIRIYGHICCEVCGYFNPSYPPFGLIETHHIRRSSDGGKDDASNYICLCPTHHGAADRISRSNPTITRMQLLSALKGGHFLSTNAPCHPQLNSLNLSERRNSMPSPTVASIKADLLRTPLTAWSRAKHAYDALTQDPHTDKDYLIIYQEVLASLAHDGYAPDQATGVPGPATKAYYESQVVNAGGSTPGGSAIPTSRDYSIPGVHAADTHSLASNPDS